MNTGTFRIAGCLTAMLALASCGADGAFEPDLRGWAGGLDTTQAAAQAAPRPQPDNRGVITFSNGQVVLAQAGDTPTTIATRLGLQPAQLASHNALPVDGVLRAGAVLVLPSQVALGTVSKPSTITSIVTDPFAKTTKTQTATPSPQNPTQHVVTSGETAWSVARKYNVSVKDLAAWNGLPTDMDLRVGQRLIVPKAGEVPDALATTAPGSGSPTPKPPSAAEPLPDETTAPASAPAPAAPSTDLGATRTAASGGGPLKMPVDGSIIRVYEKGRNDGIDIAAPSGTQVTSAGSGTVAALTRDTSGVPIIVVRHPGDLMTVYTGLENVDVAKGDTVTAGQSLGKAGNSGFVHFEVRRGFESVDPEKMLN
ncbi:LysM peptidoglycan-binding domain-containing protein [Paracoccus sp. JM45]|uniref:LysM peptidoglycan-binding domain-containing protein n=1 Tax=Paracoccus sp. JM45 TaxID=2283626 RepID=UPI00160225CE|nr:LysM peptidoglycan-binding domain-containing protein [Paracoccus sp. JM45]